MRCFLLIIREIFVISWMLLSCAAAAQSHVNSSEQPLYTNHAYGFALTLPPDVTYTRTVPPNPDHGVGISLNDTAKLWVDASYTDSSSTEEEAGIKSKGCRVEDRRASKLGDRPALTIRFSCPASAYNNAYEELLILTVLQVGDRSPVDYQVGLRANTKELLAQNLSLFKKVVSGFQFEK